MTLIVIPVLYSLVEGGKAGFGARFGGGEDEEPTAERVPTATEPPAPAEG